MARKIVPIKQNNVYIIAGITILILIAAAYWMYVRTNGSDTDTDSDSDDDEQKSPSKKAETCSTCKVGVKMENFI